MKTIEFKDIADFHQFSGMPEPENPLFSASHKLSAFSDQFLDKIEAEEGCAKADQALRFSCDFYNISLKNIIQGEIAYGKTKYDCDKGTMLFTAPNQSLVFKGVVFISEAYHICFHKDFIRGTDLYGQIKKFGFFEYHANEALHLSPKEEKMVKVLFQNIENEYHNNQDEFSKEIILSQLTTLLKYADRFYKRQFLDRKQLNQTMLSQFRAVLNAYNDENRMAEEGIPTVDFLASELGVSHRYMSDTIKAETGKTAIDQINLFLVDEAKNLLLDANVSISETAYKLGFEYPQYFSRLFKKKTGMSPKAYIQANT